MKTWFQLQYLMLIRSVREAGLHPLVALTLSLGLLCLLVFLGWDRVPHPDAVFSILLLTAMTKLMLRPRNEFMEMVFGTEVHYRLRIAENLILAIPFTICLILKQAWVWTVLFPVTATLAAFFRTDPGSGRVLPTPFGKIPYEVPAGFRKTLPWIALSAAVLAAGILSGNHALFPASLIILVLVSASYYGEPDEPLYIWIFKTTPRTFLFKKFRASAWFTVTLAIPVLIAALTLDSQWLPVLTGILLFGLCLNALVIAGRYSSFPSKLSFANGLIMAFAVIFLPLFPIVLVWLIRRSERRLSTLLV